MKDTKMSAEFGDKHGFMFINCLGHVTRVSGKALFKTTEVQRLHLFVIAERKVQEPGILQ
jgi:hypothetical protein